MRMLAVLLLLAPLAGCRSSTGVYDLCDDDFDCPDLSYCEPVTVNYTTPPVTVTDTFCTIDCAFDTDCPVGVTGENGYCLQFPGVSYFSCYERCQVEDDCRRGWRCEELVGTPSGDPVCVPAPP